MRVRPKAPLFTACQTGQTGSGSWKATNGNFWKGPEIFFGDFLQTWETHTEDITAALGSEIVIECEFSSNVDANAFLGIAFANFEIEVE